MIASTGRTLRDHRVPVTRPCDLVLSASMAYPNGHAA
jgi:hypothetical protein